MLKDGTENKIEQYVKNGGNFVMTYLSAVVDKDDLCFLGGLPANKLKDVFGIWCEETDSLPDDLKGKASFNGSEYDVEHICDIIHSNGAKVLGEYKSDFYAGMPSVTENTYKSGRAYYVAFRNDRNLANDFCRYIIEKEKISADTDIVAPSGVSIRKRGKHIFIMNFSDDEKHINLDREYENALTGKTISRCAAIGANEYLILK